MKCPCRGRKTTLHYSPPIEPTPPTAPHPLLTLSDSDYWEGKGKRKKKRKFTVLSFLPFFPPAKEWILSVNGPTPLFFSCLDKAFIRQKKRAGPLLQTAVHVSLYSWSIFVHNKPKMIQESSWRLLCFTRLALVPQKEGLWEKKWAFGSRVYLLFVQQGHIPDV